MIPVSIVSKSANSSQIETNEKVLFTFCQRKLRVNP